MIECIRTAARDSKTERIKVSCLDIIVTMIGKKPYYEIKYKEIGEDYYHVGYSSYKLENVLAWKDECFEIVKECRPQTNADRIRSMTDEELLDFLCSIETYEQGSVKTIEGGVAMCSVTEVEQWLKAESDYIECEKNFTILLSMIGKTVFLTREEAEAKLKEMEGESDVL